MEWFYSIYGLGLSSNCPIPGLRVTHPSGEVDVSVVLGEMPAHWSGTEAAARLYYESPSHDHLGVPVLRVFQPHDNSSFFFHYCDDTRFVVDCAGTKVWASWPNELTADDAATYLLGPVLGFVLRLRGFICLHASAVAVHGKAIALVGTNGAGKSTIAAKFAELGCGVLSDDLLPIREHGQRVLAEPGYPRLRLWPESVLELAGHTHDLPQLTPTWDKRYLDLTDCFVHTFAELVAIYVLGNRSHHPSAPYLENISRAEAYVELISNTYSTYLLDKPMRAREFELLGSVLNKVLLKKVIPHAQGGTVGRLCSLILEDLEAS